MKKRKSKFQYKNNFLKNIVWIILIILFALAILFVKAYTGFATENSGGQHTIGPSAEEQSCMMTCMGCTSPGVGCTGDSATCQAQCNAQKPETTEETNCMEICVVRGCEEYDFACQTRNRETCEKECNMIKEPEAKSEEEQCIRDCVNAVSPGTICGASQTGETGNEVCKNCAKQCEYLYAGPCLSGEKLETKKQACMTCEHCYAKTIMGDSGEGWECIVNVECADASSEFGDNPGTGEGITNTINGVTESIGNVVEAIGEFFSNLFGGEASAE